MPRPLDFIPRTLSARINLETVSAITALLIASVLAVSIGTRLITREEAGRQANQTLDGISYRIDNTLLSVEETAAIIAGDINNNLNNPDKLFDLCRKAVEANPYISGCAIALSPDHYTVKGKPFMAYVHRAHEDIIGTGNTTRHLVESQTFTSIPFTEQDWYIKPLLEGAPSWVGPLKNEKTETDPIISYDVPVISDGITVGVLGVDASLSVLTGIAQNYKTSTNSYITLLDGDGSYIIHPDSTRLIHMNSLQDLRDAEDPAVMEVLSAMVAGKEGKRQFTLNSTPYYMAYMPFRQVAAPGRHVGNPEWSIAVIYPRDELFQEYDPGFRYAILFTLAGILVLLAGCEAITRANLKPLRQLTTVTKSIAKGEYQMPDFDTKQKDEVGRLQAHFVKMMKALKKHMDQLQNLSASEVSRQIVLSRTYAKTKGIEKQRNAFFSNMTHQMADVVAEIRDSMDTLGDEGLKMDEAETIQVLDNIEKNGVRVTEILTDMLNSKS